MADIIKLDMTKIWAASGDKIQPTDAQIASGWLVQQVPRQTWNWYENRQDVNIAYMLQKGFPEWDSTTEYIANKSYTQRAGIVYKALQTATNQDPSTATAYWTKAFPESSASLEALRAVVPAADRLPYFTSATAATFTTLSSFMRTVLDDTTAAAARTTLGAQTLHANLTAMSTGLVAGINVLPYFDSTTSMAGTNLTGFARTLLDDADAAAARATLDVLSTTTAAANLEAVRITLQPLSTLLTSIAAQTTSANTMTYYTGANVAAVTSLTAFGRGFIALADAAAARTNIGADNATNLTTGTIPLARIPTTLTGINAATATALQTARTIQGVSFNGTANIVLPVVPRDTATGSASMPTGTTAQRTASPSNGMMRYNSDTNEFEGYQNGGWAGIGGGNPLFTVLWWPSRLSIPPGYVPADGQLLTRSAYQAAWDRIAAGDVPGTTEVSWNSSGTQHGYYSSGDGTTNFRVPDLNGKVGTSLGAVFLRGDGGGSTGTNGAIQADGFRDHLHGLVLRTDSGALTANAGGDAGPQGVVSGGSTAAAALYGVGSATTGGTETRPINITGVWIIKLIGGATAASQQDAAIAVAALDAAVIKKATAVSTISFSGGYTTGALLEIGNNASGTWFKFANGMMICCGAFVGYDASVVKTFSMPVAFNGAINVQLSCNIVPSTGYDADWTAWTSTSVGNFHSPNARASNTVVWMATGRWV